MANEREYNGWTNYETWAVNLWIGNEEGSYNYWQEAAQECNDLPRHEIFKERTAAIALAERLKDEITKGAPELGASMYSDLLGAALSEVNWHEIAEGLLEE